jgi:hypothetical protein
VLFLVLFLFYCAYFMLRFSIEPGRAGAHLRRLRALRRRADPGQLLRDPARERLHPPDGVHARRAADDGLDVRAFCICWAAITLLAYVMYRDELAGKRTDREPAGAPRGAAR